MGFREKLAYRSPAGEWYGVSVHGQGRVTALDLSDNDLTGRIPVNSAS